jgi:hypothetical protein
MIMSSWLVSEIYMSVLMLGIHCIFLHIHSWMCFVDVIGLMTGISVEREYIRDGKLTKMVIVELTDHR